MIQNIMDIKVKLGQRLLYKAFTFIFIYLNSKQIYKPQKDIQTYIRKQTEMYSHKILFQHKFNIHILPKQTTNKHLDKQTLMMLDKNGRKKREESLDKINKIKNQQLKIYLNFQKGHLFIMV